MTSPLAGIVLAAGASTRMGRPKAFLPMTPGGSVLGRVLGTLTDAGIAPLVVVARSLFVPSEWWTDPRADERVRVVVNEAPERGQLSSLLCGIAALPEDAPAALMTLVDIPLVQTSTVRALIGAWQTDPAVLVRPVHEGRHGHPVIFGRALLRALANADPAHGAKPVVRSFAHEGLDVPVEDPGILIDLDTPDEYARHA
jgi:molybdenum cofactor cytidylyltransferase